MSLTRDENLAIIRNKLVLLGFITDVDVAHNIPFIEHRLELAFRPQWQPQNPWRDVGEQIRVHRIHKMNWTRQQAIDAANRILFDIGDQGFADQSALCRIEAGSQRCTYLQARALEVVFDVPPGTLTPWMDMGTAIAEQAG